MLKMQSIFDANFSMGAAFLGQKTPAIAAPIQK